MIGWMTMIIKNSLTRLIQSNTSLEQMEEAITIGINNGYSMDDQFKLMREILTKQN
jgi:hypothetical protein